MFTVKIHFLDSKGFCPHPSHSDFSHVPEDKWSPTPQADGIYKLPKSSPHQLPRVKTWNTVWNTTWKCSGSCPEHSITSFQQRAAPPPRGKVTGSHWLHDRALSLELCADRNFAMQSDGGQKSTIDTRILRCFNLKPLFCCEGEGWL